MQNEGYLNLSDDTRISADQKNKFEKGQSCGKSKSYLWQHVALEKS